jgi:hypothetical protein
MNLTHAIVQLGHSRRIKLLLLDADPVFEYLLPSLLEQPGAVAGTPPLLRNLLHIAIVVVAAHDRAELRELLDDLLLYISVQSRPQT